MFREIIQDPLLTKYNVVMLDEVHEGTLASEVILAILKRFALVVSPLSREGCSKCQPG